MRPDYRHRRPPTPRAFLLALLFIIGVGVPPAVTVAQEHAPQQPPPARGAQAQDAPAAEAHEPEHDDGGILQLMAKLANFAILVGVLVYFLKSPLLGFLVSRIAAVKQDLAAAKEMRAAAEAQLAEIDRNLAALPAELDALKKQGAEDVRAEQARITHAAAVERERLLDQTRREIEMRLRIARRELTAHAAELAVGVARERIARAITPEDQIRLVDRYTTQIREAR